MGRPVDPTSRNQVDQRAKRLRDPENRWREMLLETLALGCLKAQRWALYLDDGGDPGPLAGPFPKLPETPGERVRIGYRVEEIPHNSPEARYFVTWDVSEDDHEEMPSSPVSVDIVEAVVERLEIHVRNLLSPSFYREVASWMGEILASDPREEPEPGGVGPFHDIWTVPAMVLPWDPTGELRPSLETFLHRAAAWHFARVLYRKLLDPRPIHGLRGLERPALLRQLLEELEILKPGGLKTQPVGEKALARATTHEVPMLGFRAFPRPDKWDETEDGRGRYLHERRGANGYRRWELTLQEGREDLAFASLARCQQVLEKGGLEITALHGLLCCLVMQQEDPSSRFEVRGDDLLKDLGYTQGGREGSTRSDRLRLVAQAATVLRSVLCDGQSRNHKVGQFISMKSESIWNIAVQVDGQLKLLDGPGEERLGTVTDLTLTVTPGTWVQSQRDRATGSHLLYVPMATRVLSLGRYRQELAFRLGIHLAMGVRERRQYQGGRANVRVGQLLEEVLPKGELERAFQDRDTAHKLRDRWKAALHTLHTVVGFRFEFPPDQYPPALIPEDLRPEGMADPGPVGHGALDRLLASRLEIHWPEPVVEAMHQRALPQREREAALQVRQQQKKALQSRPNGARLREALEKAKASGAITGRRDAAKRLGMSVSQLSKLENSLKPLPERELQRCLALLETFRPGKS